MAARRCGDAVPTPLASAQERCHGDVRV